MANSPRLSTARSAIRETNKVDSQQKYALWLKRARRWPALQSRAEFLSRDLRHSCILTISIQRSSEANMEQKKSSQSDLGGWKQLECRNKHQKKLSASTNSSKLCVQSHGRVLPPNSKKHITFFVDTAPKLHRPQNFTSYTKCTFPGIIFHRKSATE